MPENKPVFMGTLASYLEAFITEKRTLGCRYVEEERLAHEFDKLSLQFDCCEGMSHELVDEFIKFKPNWQATTQKRHISFVQNFGRYLINHDINAFLPGYISVRKAKSCFKPYIFSHSEIDELFMAADKIRPNCRNSHILYPVLFRLLYGTGIRISEALNLTIADVDLNKKTIHVTNPKNKKDRVLPVSDSLAEYCCWYQTKIHSIYHNNDQFFKSNRGNGHYCRNNIQVYFSNIVANMNLPSNGYKGGGPHLHCLRHTFCVHSLEQMLKADVTHGVALQLLSAYMGHQSLSATAKYLQLTAEAFPDLLAVIEDAYHDIFPKIEMIKEVRMPYEND
ncbi:MAG: tyrosine-type recombinase/integrase [Candidatus Riflebacteria bacterium]|nr:tyrosine-type recombinase/integrase [Candidatus Riflebacteria bacterium]